MAVTLPAHRQPPWSTSMAKKKRTPPRKANGQFRKRKKR